MNFIIEKEFHPILAALKDAGSEWISSEIMNTIALGKVAAKEFTDNKRKVMGMETLPYSPEEQWAIIKQALLQYFVGSSKIYDRLREDFGKLGNNVVVLRDLEDDKQELLSNDYGKRVNTLATLLQGKG